MAASQGDEKSPQPSNGQLGCCNLSILALPVGLVGAAIQLYRHSSSAHDGWFAEKVLAGFVFGFIAGVFGSVLVVGLLVVFRKDKH